MTTSHYQAARENLFGHVPFLQRRMPGMLIRDLGGALLVDSGLGSDTFNKVLWECGGDGRPCRVERGAEDGLLQASKDWFAGKRPRDLLELPGMALPPATERPFTVWASAEDEGARGSSFAASASSQVVTVILHSTGEWDVISRRISASRVMSVPFVATAAPKP